MCGLAVVAMAIEAAQQSEVTEAVGTRTPNGVVVCTWLHRLVMHYIRHSQPVIMRS